MLRASEFIQRMEHAIGGEPDPRMSSLGVLNEALAFLFNMHDWKFRRRPPLDVSFQAAASPTVQAITAIARVSGTVTVTVASSPTPPFVAGQTFIVAGVTDTSFNGSFQLVTAGTTSATYVQAGVDAASSGGTVGQYAYEQFIDLPSDVKELIAVCTKNSTINTIIPTGLEEIAWRRGSPNATAYDAKYRYALSFPSQTSTDVAQAAPRLELWPRPNTANPLGDLTITYRAGPVPLVLDDTHDTTPNIPESHQRLLTLLARLFMQGYEEDVIQEDPIIQAEVAMLLEADGRQEANIGLLKGGAVQRRSQYQIREFQSIGNPANRLS